MLVPRDAEVAYPLAEESIIPLNRSGWHLNVTTFTDCSDRTIWEITGRQGENRIKVEAASPCEAWSKAALAAAACGMLAGWPRPSDGTR